MILFFQFKINYDYLFFIVIRQNKFIVILIIVIIKYLKKGDVFEYSIGKNKLGIGVIIGVN